MNPGVPEGSVIITPTQMYEEIQLMRRDVQTLTALVDPAMSDVRAEVKALKAEIESLKNWRAAIAGALTLLGALVSYGMIHGING